MASSSSSHVEMKVMQVAKRKIIDGKKEERDPRTLRTMIRMGSMPEEFIPLMDVVSQINPDAKVQDANPSAVYAATDAGIKLSRMVDQCGIHELDAFGQLILCIGKQNADGTGGLTRNSIIQSAVESVGEIAIKLDLNDPDINPVFARATLNIHLIVGNTADELIRLALQEKWIKIVSKAVRKPMICVMCEKQIEGTSSHDCEEA